ncbi:tyrosine-type recombinase/integrase [Falsirhodobacter sp. 20TX0035]|uniref:tyrosine-type recombinase/integrase n=1 Tax=Falsirhodobacter sp. 20TX0035 TaxID=3022019 RepID=UPI002FE499E3
MKGIVFRGNCYYLRRRLPTRYEAVDERRIIKVSLHTDSEPMAISKAAQVWSEMVEAWEARLAGDTEDAEKRIEAAKNLAATRGYRFLQVRDVVTKLPEAQVIERMRSVMETSTPEKPDMMAAAALLGAVPKPSVRMSKVAESFFALAEDRTLGKSKDQIRRWENPRKKAVATFIETVGDKAIEDITTDDLFEMRTALMRKVREGGLAPGSANKDFTYLTNMLATVAASKGIDLTYKTKGLKLAEGKKRTRSAFSVSWLKDTLLAPGALDGLNLEARCILLGMVNTGYRPSEAQGLLAKHIRLDAAVPHIEISPEGRTLKNHHSERVIPLLGVSLEAFKACPSGFPRYRDNPGLSDTVNKYLRENKLLETADHTLYGLRHSFEDRMLEAGIDERIRRDLFGHALNRERYGKGASLAHIAGLLAPIAL